MEKWYETEEVLLYKKKELQHQCNMFLMCYHGTGKEPYPGTKKQLRERIYSHYEWYKRKQIWQKEEEDRLKMRIAEYH